MDFAEWITQELHTRGWSKREAAKRAHVSPSMMEKVIRREANPGMSFYKGLSRAFKISLLEVLVRAGEISINDIGIEEINKKLSLLPDWQQKMVLTVIDSFLKEGPNANSTLPLATPLSKR